MNIKNIFILSLLIQCSLAQALDEEELLDAQQRLEHSILQARWLQIAILQSYQIRTLANNDQRFCDLAQLVAAIVKQKLELQKQGLVIERVWIDCIGQLALFIKDINPNGRRPNPLIFCRVSSSF